MKIKNFLLGVIFIAAVMLSACSSKPDPETAAADEALKQRLLGVWCYINSAVYDAEGNLTSFDAYEFTEQVAKRHTVTETQISSMAIDKYSIENGLYIVEVNGKKQSAIISIEEVDGKDHLYWNTDSGKDEFLRMTDEEVELFHIPAGQLLTSEAELLGIETTVPETESISVTTAASE